MNIEKNTKHAALIIGFLFGCQCLNTSANDGALASDAETHALAVGSQEALHLSPAENILARQQLKDAGAPVIAMLTEALSSELEKRDADGVIRAIRTLRALREMRTLASIPLCEKILLSQENPAEVRPQGALLSEALMTVCDLFPDSRAVDVYVRFVLEKQHLYSVTRDVNLHWGQIVRENNMTADVLYGISPLVKSGDARSRMVLVKVLKMFTADSLDHGAGWLLDSDGFTLVQKRWGRDHIMQQLHM